MTGGVQEIDDNPEIYAEALAAVEEVEATEAATPEDNAIEPTDTSGDPG